jgi:hypothetical protein
VTRRSSTSAHAHIANPSTRQNFIIYRVGRVGVDLAFYHVSHLDWSATYIPAVNRQIPHGVELVRHPNPANLSEAKPSPDRAAPPRITSLDSPSSINSQHTSAVLNPSHIHHHHHHHHHTYHDGRQRRSEYHHFPSPESLS